GRPPTSSLAPHRRRSSSPAAGGTCRRGCSPRRSARSTGTPAWSPATLSPRSAGSRLRDGGPMDVGGATLAAAGMRGGLIDEYAIVTHPVLVGGGTPFFTALDNWVNLNLVETRTFPDGVLLTRYETRR